MLSIQTKAIDISLPTPTATKQNPPRKECESSLTRELQAIKQMRVRSSKKNQLIDKEEIVNYQYLILEQTTPQVKPTIANTDKYGVWELNNKMRDVVGSQAHLLRWIGNTDTAYLETYAYILLIGSGHSQTNFLQFKHMAYKLGRKCLLLAEQKLLVEFLCLIEYSCDRYSFLNKYPQIEAVFIKILQYLEEEHTNSEDSVPDTRKAKVRRRQNRPTDSNNKPNKLQPRQSGQSLSNELQSDHTDERQLQQIYACFNRYFQFISILGSNEYSCTLKLFNSKKVHVLIEKDCYFMLEPSESIQDANNFTLAQKLPHTPEESSSDGKARFDKQEFQQIFNYNSEVEESNVRPVERGSEIRKPEESSIQGRFSTPKFNLGTQHMDWPREFQIQRTDQRIENDRTFIDQLLTNVVLPNDGNQPKEGKETAMGRKRRLMQEKMKGISMIKQQLAKVRQKIEDKLRNIDQAEKTTHTFADNTNENDHSPITPKGKQSRNLVKDSVVHKQSLGALFKKDRKTSYNSMKQSPKAMASQQDFDVQAEKMPERNSMKYLRLYERMLSEKSQSRPHSNFRSLDEEQARGRRRALSPSPDNLSGNNSVDVALTRPMSPGNLKVNVNVSINERQMQRNHAFPRAGGAWTGWKGWRSPLTPTPSSKALPTQTTLANPQRLFCKHNRINFLYKK